MEFSECRLQSAPYAKASNHRQNNSVLFLFFCILLIGTFCACSKTDKNIPPSDTATSGSFELVADETLKPVVDSLIKGFSSQTPDAHVTVKYTSASEALDLLLSNKARLVLIARPLTAREHHLLDSTKTDLPEFDVALNSIAVIASAKSARTSIDLDTLRSMVLEKGSARYYSTSYLSATETCLDSVFNLTNTTLAGNIKRFQTSDSVIAAVKADPSAIGFISSSWLHSLTSAADTAVKALPITSPKSQTPIILHLAYIYQGLYPLVSRVCAYTTEVPNSIPRGFLAYAMSADGQRVFLKYDVLPRTQIIKIVAPK